MSFLVATNLVASQSLERRMLVPISAHRFIKSNSSGTGKGGSADWNYCNSKLCDEGQGDCDSDSQCKGSLQCGTHNCKNYHDIAEPTADCCYRTGIQLHQ